MFWSRRRIPRLAVLAILGLASIAGTGDLALPDEHVMLGGQSVADQSPLPQESGSSSDTQPEHTCHCVHAHGLAVVTLAEPFRVWGSVRTIAVETTVSAVRPAAAPPFHPPKTLS